MSQYDVSEVFLADGKRLLLEIQSDLLSDLDTVVVVPLASVESIEKIPVLHVEVEVGGGRYFARFDQMSSVRRRALGDFVVNLSGSHYEFMSAYDMVFGGI